MPTDNPNEKLGEILEKAMSKIIIAKGVDLKDPANKAIAEELMLAGKAFSNTKPQVGSLFHALDQFERRVNNNTLSKIITKDGKTETGYTPYGEAAIGSIMIGSKIFEDLAVWNSDFVAELGTQPRILNRIEALHATKLDWKLGIPSNDFVHRITAIGKYLDPDDLYNLGNILKEYANEGNEIQKHFLQGFMQAFAQQIDIKKAGSIHKKIQDKATDDIKLKPSKTTNMFTPDKDNKAQVFEDIESKLTKYPKK